MGMYDGMLPEVQAEGKRGFYPVTTAQEWDDLPCLYKAMDWKPVKVYNPLHNTEEMTVAEYIEFDVIYMEPYKIQATVKVHVQEIQKIMFCLYKNPSVHLYSISGVVFQNGIRWGAKWKQDAVTGAYAVYASDKQIGVQGGYRGYIPCCIEKTDGGFKRKIFPQYAYRSHFEYSNPFI